MGNFKYYFFGIFRSRQLDLATSASPRPLLLPVPSGGQDLVCMDGHGTHQPHERLLVRDTRHAQRRVSQARLPEMVRRGQLDVLRHTRHRPGQGEPRAFGDGERRHGVLSPHTDTRLGCESLAGISQGHLVSLRLVRVRVHRSHRDDPGGIQARGREAHLEKVRPKRRRQETRCHRSVASQVTARNWQTNQFVEKKEY